MSSITAQQTKLDLELVPKENRIDIGKCIGRIPRGLTPRQPTFQVILDAITLTPCYPAFLITTDVPEGREFDPLPSEEDTVSFLRELDHTREINSLNDVVVNQMHPGELLLLLSTRVYQERLVVLTSFVSLELKSFGVKESKAYKTYLGHATGVVPPKIARKFKKASPSKKDSIPVQADEEPIQKGKRVKRSAKKSSTTSAAVALAEKAQLKEVRKKSLRDFYKTRPSSSGIVAKKLPSFEKITPTVISEGTDDKPGVPDENESEEQDEESDDDNQEEEEVDQGNESEDDEIESDEDKGMDDTTYQFDDDVDARLKEPTQTDKEVVQGEGADAEMIDAQQGNENLETTQEQVVEDAYVTISTVTKKTEVPTTSSSCSSDLASKFLNFLDIPHTDAEIVSPLDVHVHHEVPRAQAPTLLTIPISIITESSPVLINIPQSSQTFTPPPILTTPTPLSTIETTNPISTLLDFASVFRFNDKITTLEKEVSKIKKDPLHTQVTSLVDEHLDIRLGETREEFMNFLSESLMARIKEQVKNQLPQILPKEVSNFAPLVIEKLIKESRDEVTLAKVSSQPQSTYEAASTLIEFELKKILLLDKMEKNFFYSYDVYSLKRGRKDKDKDEDPSARSDRGLKKRKLSKDAEPTTGPKKKDSTSGSSKGTKSQPKSSGKSVQSEEPVFEVADSDMPQDQEGNLGDNEDEPRNETASRRDWFKKPTPPQEPTDPDWNIGKTTQEGPTQNWLMTLAASTSTDKSLKDFDELMSTLIDFSSYVLNGLKIENLTQEVLLGPAFRLLKGTRSNYAELEYDFEECYKALSEKLDWENPKGGDYPFDLSKPLPLIKRGKRQRVPFEFFINNDLKYLQGGISTMTYTTSTTKTKAAKYDLPGIEDMVPNIWSPVKVAYDRYALWGILHWRQQRKSFYAYARGIQSRGDVYSTKRIMAVTHVKVMRKHGYGYLEEIVVRRANNVLYRFKEGDDVADFVSLVIQKRVEDLQLGVESYQKKINVTKPDTTRPDLKKRHPYTPYRDPQGFIYVDDHKRNRLMRSDKLYKFSDGTLTRLLSSLEDITKNINMEYLPKRKWSNLEKKRAYFMIKDINKLLKERRMMRSLEKFIGGRLYGTDLRLLQRII
ncbi:hypothetical protein Tco_0839255 [Tanacetum coccineum]|uniref:Uncharacterized protein n=1 Tax=Tanacetum coccineum TaxID=301880 RepID=A0ABQ5AR07_9ASTR